MRVSRKFLTPAGADAPKKPSKVGNRKITLDGQTFDSAKEARRYQDLKLMERAGEIRFLRTQVGFPLVCNGVTVARYFADFVYVRQTDDVQVVEDVKSEITRKDKTYRLKAKMMAAMGVPVTEV